MAVEFKILSEGDFTRYLVDDNGAISRLHETVCYVVDGDDVAEGNYDGHAATGLEYKPVAKPWPELRACAAEALKTGRDFFLL